MKALFLSAAAAIAIPTAANSASVTVGGPLAVHCYEAALDRLATRASFQACDRSLAEEPLDRADRAATLTNLGILHMIGGSFVEADSNFDAAIATDPEAADPWLNKAFLRLRMGDGAEALPLLERAMELRSQRDALIYFARGIAHEQAGDIRAAYADLVRARDLEPDWSMPAKALARYQVRSR